MRKNLNIVITTLLICFLSTAYSQERGCVLIDKKHRWHGYNLNGPVRSVRWFYTHIKEELSNQDKQRVKLKNDVRPTFYTEFNEFGLVTKMIMFSKDYRDMPLDSGKVEIYRYDSYDLQEKFKCRKTNVQSPVVFNQTQLLKVNHLIVSGLYGSTSQYIYSYEYNKKSKKIKEVCYSSFFSDSDKIAISTKGELLKQDILFTRLFFYAHVAYVLTGETERSWPRSLIRHWHRGSSTAGLYWLRVSSPP